MHYRRLGKTDDFPGIMVQSEAPLLVTNEVSLVDPSDEYVSLPVLPFGRT